MQIDTDELGPETSASCHRQFDCPLSNRRGVIVRIGIKCEPRSKASPGPFVSNHKLIGRLSDGYHLGNPCVTFTQAGATTAPLCLANFAARWLTAIRHRRRGNWWQNGRDRGSRTAGQLQKRSPGPGFRFAGRGAPVASAGGGHTGLDLSAGIPCSTRATSAPICLAPALSRQLYRACSESRNSPRVMPLRRHLATVR